MAIDVRRFVIESSSTSAAMEAREGVNLFVRVVQIAMPA